MQIGNNFHAADGLWIEAISAFYEPIIFPPELLLGTMSQLVAGLTLRRPTMSRLGQILLSEAKLLSLTTITVSIKDCILPRKYLQN